jgi:hypothetical protein
MPKDQSKTITPRMPQRSQWGIPVSSQSSGIEPIWTDRHIRRVTPRLECSSCGSRPYRFELITDKHKAGDQCPCCYLDDYDCDGTLVEIPPGEAASYLTMEKDPTKDPT